MMIASRVRAALTCVDLLDGKDLSLSRHWERSTRKKILGPPAAAGPHGTHRGFRCALRDVSRLASGLRPTAAPTARPASSTPPAEGCHDELADVDARAGGHLAEADVGKRPAGVLGRGAG